MTVSNSRVIDVAAAELAHEALPPHQVTEGAPTTGLQELGQLGDAHYGIWEITPGVSTDVESDEVFVVLSGRARIDFSDDGSSIDVGPGDLVRLRADDKTVWTVSETLRKVYVRV
ncbi:cupin domain-containing protein [Leifsonia aquatica]|uniref:cupin domain-containing protein n=1 Tax=Leifsonia aquatica TaxID=144185 RepID=UPI0028AC2C7A|nr:cupin domain-containing protein [Leifsonia aquatica]